MVDKRLSAALQQFVDGVAELHPGAELTFTAKNLSSGQDIFFGSEEELECASIVKIFLAYFFFTEKGEILAHRVEVDPKIKNSLYGAGILKFFTRQCSISYQDLIVLMLCLSDNIATNLIIEKLGGIEQVSIWMNNKLGISSTGLVQPISKELKERGQLSLFTAKDFTGFFEYLDSCGNPEAREKLFACMQDTTSLGNDRLARSLPAHLFPPESETVIASKGGTFTRPEVTCDLLYLREPSLGPLVIFAHTQGINDPDDLPRSHIDHAANRCLAQLGSLLYEELAIGSQINKVQSVR